MSEDVFRGHGVEVSISDPDNFLKIMETLTRIGVASRKANTLYQSCHILHKQGRYAIVHFKEMFDLDGKETDITAEDLGRRNRIATLLEEWNLLKIVNPKQIASAIAPMSQVKVVRFKDKDKWLFESKYTIGNKKR